MVRMDSALYRGSGATARIWMVAFVLTCHLALVSSQKNLPGYQGCFTDVYRLIWTSYYRALPVGPKESDVQSVEWCFRYCLETSGSEYTYAGLEYENECFCGNDDDYGRHGKNPNTDCRDRCSGNDHQICGDSNRLSVYRILDGVCSNIGQVRNGRGTITNPPSVSYNLRGYKFLGTRVKFQCDSGYALHGASSIQCVDTGDNAVAWTETLPNCEQPESTTHTTSPPSVDVSSSAITFQQTAGADNASQPEETTRADNGTDHTLGYGTEQPASRAPPTARPMAGTTTGFGSGGQTGARLSTGTLAGLVGAGVAVTAVVLLAFIALTKKRNRRKRGPSPTSATVNFTNNAYDLPETNGADRRGRPEEDQEEQEEAAAGRTAALPIYCQVVRKKKGPAPDDANARPADVTDSGASAAAAAHDNGQVLYANAPAVHGGGNPGVVADGCTDSTTGPPLSVEEQSGWVENIIYE